MKEILYEEIGYPTKLMEINNPPKILYTLGNTELLKIPGIAIVGSRNSTEYGRKYAKKFSRELAQVGFCIISGMAKGIDKIAHEAAIEIGGRTIAVLGSGFNNIYPKENKELFYKIIETNNLVITEYDVNMKPSKENFSKRNRIISGLAIGVLIIEAAYRSGTSITANYAINQGKNVFCIPHAINESKGIGTNNLIKKGARLVTNTQEIINSYETLKLHPINKKEIVINHEYLEVYKVIKNIPTSIDEIYSKINKNTSEINMILTMLEMEEKIRQVSGTMYERI